MVMNLLYTTKWIKNMNTQYYYWASKAVTKHTLHEKQLYTQLARPIQPIQVAKLACMLQRIHLIMKWWNVLCEAESPTFEHFLTPDYKLDP